MESNEQRIENPCVGGSIPPRATKITGLQPESVLRKSITHSLHSFNLGIRCKTLHSMFISFAEQYAQKTNNSAYIQCSQIC